MRKNFEGTIESVLKMVFFISVIFFAVSVYEASISTIRGSGWSPPLAKSVKKSIDAIAEVEAKLDARCVPSSQMQEIASGLVKDLSVTNITMKPVASSRIVQAEVKGVLQTSKLHKFISAIGGSDKISAVTNLKISPRISYAPHGTDDVTDPLMDIQIILNFVKER